MDGRLDITRAGRATRLGPERLDQDFRRGGIAGTRQEELQDGLPPPAGAQRHLPPVAAEPEPTEADHLPPPPRLVPLRGRPGRGDAGRVAPLGPPSPAEEPADLAQLVLQVQQAIQGVLERGGAGDGIVGHAYLPPYATDACVRAGPSSPPCGSPARAGDEPTYTQRPPRSDVSLDTSRRGVGGRTTAR